MNKTMGEYGTFWFYMSWCVVGVFFVYFFLPETKGKSFEEIERMFANKKKQQLYAAGAETTIGAAADKNDVFTVETIPRAHIDERSSQSHSNDGYDMDSDEEDNGEVVATPL
jgi:facilitated trehalose transporter